MSSLADDLHVTPAASGQAGAVIVMLPDEIDIANAAAIAAQLRTAADSPTSTVIADMTQTTFCDAAGFRTLLNASRHAAARNVRFAVACSSIHLLRMHRLLGLSGLLPVYPNAAAALRQLGSGQS